MKINYDRLPEHMRGSTREYIERGRRVGHFLTAVLSNDLMEAFSRADDTNRNAMIDWVQFLYNDAPGPCHGSPEAVKNWMDRGGLVGTEETRVGA